MRTKDIRLWALAVGALLLMVGETPRPALADRDEADEILDRYLSAYNGGDPAQLAALYTDDALLMPHERPMARGREEIQAFWRRRILADHLRQTGFPLLVKTLQRNVGSDTGYVVGSFLRREGETGLNFVIGLKRNDHGEWRIAAEVWNSTELKPRYQPAS